MKRWILERAAQLLLLEDRVCFLLGYESAIGHALRHAHDVGFQQGLVAGRAEAQAELEQLRATLASGVQA